MTTKNRFKDTDLHTPAHDAIMLWLQDNAREIMFRHFEMDKLIEKARQEVETFMKSNSLPEEKSPDFDAAMMGGSDSLNVSVKWEVPVPFHGGQRYIDMQIRTVLHVPTANMGGSYKEILKKIGGEWKLDRVFASNGKSYLGSESYEFNLSCEVKSTIGSIGELIRQLRQYESAKAPVAVVSPDDRFRDVIESQGFIFIKAPKPDVGPQGALI